jgi:hypothetical protein
MKKSPTVMEDGRLTLVGMLIGHISQKDSFSQQLKIFFEFETFEAASETNE